jgi:hypothetical protein
MSEQPFDEAHDIDDATEVPSAVSTPLPPSPGPCEHHAICQRQQTKQYLFFAVHRARPHALHDMDRGDTPPEYSGDDMSDDVRAIVFRLGVFVWVCLEIQF